MEEVDDPVNGVDNVDDPGEVVDDVQKRIFVLDRLDGLIGVEDEEEDEPEEVEEAKDCAPVAPEKKFLKLFRQICIHLSLPYCFRYYTFS